jgi:membrane protein DedA with SNARE-associated domain
VCIHVTIFTSLGYIFSPKVESIVSFIKSADRWMAVTAFLAFVMFAVFIGYVVGKHRKKK